AEEDGMDRRRPRRVRRQLELRGQQPFGVRPRPGRRHEAPAEVRLAREGRLRCGAQPDRRSGECRLAREKTRGHRAAHYHKERPVMSDPLLIYGATGYSGGLMVGGALARGLRPIVAGRDETKVRGLAARASAKTAFQHAFDGVRVRRGGQVVLVPWGELHRAFDYGDGPRESIACTWGDVGTAWYTTGIPDVAVYFEATAPLRMLELAG